MTWAYQHDSSGDAYPSLYIEDPASFHRDEGYPYGPMQEVLEIPAKGERAGRSDGYGGSMSCMSYCEGYEGYAPIPLESLPGRNIFCNGARTEEKDTYISSVGVTI